MKDIITPLSIITKKSIGPSSSHTYACFRMGKEMISQIKKRRLEIKGIELILYNSFAETGFGHGSLDAIFAGLLDMDLEKEDASKSTKVIKQRKISIKIKRKKDEKFEPNTMIVKLKCSNDKECSFVGISLGGGAIKLNEIE